MSIYPGSYAYHRIRTSGVSLRFDPVRGKRNKSIAAHVSDLLLRRMEMNAILDTTPNAVCIVTRDWLIASSPTQKSLASAQKSCTWFSVDGVRP